jgi:hypothetical protein
MALESTAEWCFPASPLSSFSLVASIFCMPLTILIHTSDKYLRVDPSLGNGVL